MQKNDSMPWQVLRMPEAVLCVGKDGENHEKEEEKRENKCMQKSECAKVGLLTIKKKKEKQKTYRNRQKRKKTNRQTYRNKHTNLRLIFMESSDSEFGLLIEDPYLGFRFTVLILTIACEKQQIQLAGRNHKGAPAICDDCFRCSGCCWPFVDPSKGWHRCSMRECGTYGKQASLSDIRRCVEKNIPKNCESHRCPHPEELHQPYTESPLAAVEHLDYGREALATENVDPSERTPCQLHQICPSKYRLSSLFKSRRPHKYRTEHELRNQVFCAEGANCVRRTTSEYEAVKTVQFRDRSYKRRAFGIGMEARLLTTGQHSNKADTNLRERKALESPQGTRQSFCWAVKQLQLQKDQNVTKK
jgi:hypothetical protein